MGGKPNSTRYQPSSNISHIPLLPDRQLSRPDIPQHPQIDRTPLFLTENLPRNPSQIAAQTRPAQLAEPVRVLARTSSVFGAVFLCPVVSKVARHCRCHQEERHTIPCVKLTFFINGCTEIWPLRSQCVHSHSMAVYVPLPSAWDSRSGGEIFMVNWMAAQWQDRG